jgi:hypothetical protein
MGPTSLRCVDGVDFGATQSLHIRFDNLSRFFDGLGSLESHANGLEVMAELIGYELQWPSIVAESLP